MYFIHHIYVPKQTYSKGFKQNDIGTCFIFYSLCFIPDFRSCFRVHMRILNNQIKANITTDSRRETTAKSTHIIPSRHTHNSTQEITKYDTLLDVYRTHTNRDTHVISKPVATLFHFICYLESKIYRNIYTCNLLLSFS